ncbi:hypothetical protein Tco_0691806 [Tanacetum coccineum]
MEDDSWTDWMEDDSWTDIILDYLYDTFYRDEEEETEVAKESEDITLSIMKEKFLSEVESEKAKVKDYTKLVATDGMVDYVLEKYGNNWKCEDEIAYVILEDLWLKYEKGDKGKGKEAEHDHLKVNKGMHMVLVDDKRKRNDAEHDHLKVNKDDKGKGKVHIQNRLEKLDVDLARAIKTKQLDNHDDDLDTLDFENRIKKLKEDFGRLLKAKETKKSKKSKKAKEAKKSKKKKDAKLAKEAKKT